MFDGPKLQRQFTSPDLDGFAIEDAILNSGAFKLSNPRTHETVFVKYTSEYEVDMTSRAVEFPRSPQSSIVLPGIIDPALIATLNPDTQNRIAEIREEMWYRIGHDKTHLLITRALPNRAPLLPPNGNKASDLMGELRGIPISRSEWRQFYYDLDVWNKAGIRHNDLLCNTFPTRDEHGKLSMNIFDFSRSDLSNCDDRDSILWAGAIILTNGPLDTRAVEWSRSQSNRSGDEHRAQFIIGIHKKSAVKGATGEIRQSSLQTIMQHVAHLPRIEQAETYRFVQQHALEGSQLWKMSAEALRKPWFRHSLNATGVPASPQTLNPGYALAMCMT
jgi:hypothetical protein